MNYVKQHDIPCIGFGNTPNAYRVTIIGIKQKCLDTWKCFVEKRCK